MKEIKTQNELLLINLIDFYKKNNNLKIFLSIINGESKISLRIIDWFVTNYSKKYYIVYDFISNIDNKPIRFKVYNDYKLNLKSYSKKRFDPFCRWERILIPYDLDNFLNINNTEIKENKYLETTIGQLNFFKWAIENYILDYIDNNYNIIENDMIERNKSTLKNNKLKNKIININDNKPHETIILPINNKIIDNKESLKININEKTLKNTNTEFNDKDMNNKTRKKREELSISACKSLKKEQIKVIVSFK